METLHAVLVIVSTMIGVALTIIKVLDSHKKAASDKHQSLTDTLEEVKEILKALAKE